MGVYNVLVNFGEDWPPFKGLAFLFSDLGASFIGTALEGSTPNFFSNWDGLLDRPG